MPVIIWPLASKMRSMTNQRSAQRGMGPRVSGAPLPTAPPLVISGVTRDSSGNPLGNVALAVFAQPDERLVERLVSDGSGNFKTSPVGPGQKYQIDAYLDGAPPQAGTSRNDLQGS